MSPKSDPYDTPLQRRIDACLIVFTLLVIALLFRTSAHGADFYWDANGPGAGTGGAGNWDNSSLLWRLGGATGTLTTFPGYGDPDNDAFLQGTASNFLTLATTIFVNDINVDPTSGTSYSITGTSPKLNLVGVTPTLNVATGDSLTISSALSGSSGFMKSGAGTLILANGPGTSNLFGPISVTSGTLQAGTSVTYGASQALRSNAVDLAAGTSLTSGSGGAPVLSVGAISGAGSVTGVDQSSINIRALSDGTFSGVVTKTSALGGLNLSGGTGTTQTFTGNVTGLIGTVGINSGATFKLSGTGDSTSGVLGSNTGSTTTIALRGGTFAMDNSGGNTSATNGRLSDGAAFTFLGGTASLIGHSTGTSETVGTITLNAGAATIGVTSNSSSAPTTLTFTDTGSLRDSTAMTVDFVGNGGTLGAGGNNPAIKFTGTPFTGTNTGLLSNSAGSDTTIGWATVTTGGDTNWAGYNGSNGIIALTNVTRDQTNLSSAGSSERVGFAPSANTTLAAPLTIGVIKITPATTGLSLNLGNNALTTTGLLFTGSNDFSITGTGALFGAAGGTRYIHTIDPNATLSIANTLAGAQQPFNKSGAGFLNLDGASNQVAFTSNQNINLLEGVTRVTPTSFGGGQTSAAGAFTSTNLYGGTLEISGGGTFVRALTFNAATSAGGTIKWSGTAAARGDGGFSAFGGEAVVSLVTAIGGSTAASPVWNQSAFVADGYALLFGSTKSDSRVVFTNSIGLDTGAATSTYFAREIRVTDNPNSSGDRARLSGVITGSANADLLKTGAGTLELTGNNTYAGNTLVHQGILQVGASGGTDAANGQLANTGKIVVNAGGTLLLGGTTASVDRLNNNAAVILAGGTFNTGGLSEGAAGTPGVGALTLSGNSIIDFATNIGTNSILAFARSSAQAWSGTLSIYNWSGNTLGNGIDQFYIGTDTIGLTPGQLSQIAFYSDSGVTFLGTAGWALDGDGELVPVPEPSTWFAAALAFSMVVYSQRHRIRTLVG